MKRFNVADYLPGLSIDCVVFGYENNQLKVLISKFRLGEGNWTLPGGYILKYEDVETAAARILSDWTGLSEVYLEQFSVFGKADRIVNREHKESMQEELNHLDNQLFDTDAREWMSSRFVSIGFYALLDINLLNNSGQKAYREWRSIHQVPSMVYDHNEILAKGLDALRSNLDQKLIAFNMLPEIFTMRELKELYEAVYDKSIAINNFQKRILDLNVLERLDKKFTGAANKAPYQYRLRKELH